MKIKTYYIVDMELHNNDKWFSIHSLTSKKEALKTINLFYNNSKDDPVMKDMKAKHRLRKITEEVILVKEIK